MQSFVCNRLTCDELGILNQKNDKDWKNMPLKAAFFVFLLYLCTQINGKEIEG